MASPMRLSKNLIEAAEREALIQKRTVPKQIEFWAEIGKSLGNLINIEDILAIKQGIKKIKIELADSVPVAPDDVFASLEMSRNSGELANQVTSAAIYYEASLSRPGLLDKVYSKTGKRETGLFSQGEFKVQ